MRQKLPILVYPDLVSGVFYIFIHRDCGESGLFMFCVYKLSIICLLYTSDAADEL